MACHIILWLSWGGVLKYFFNLEKGIEQFMEEKSKPVLEFQCLQDLALIMDIRALK